MELKNYFGLLTAVVCFLSGVNCQCSTVKLDGTISHMLQEGYYRKTGTGCFLNRNIYEHTRGTYHLYYSSVGAWAVGTYSCDTWAFLACADTAVYPEDIATYWRETRNGNWTTSYRARVTCASDVPDDRKGSNADQKTRDQLLRQVFFWNVMIMFAL